ncbi:preprotein translocase subunit SecA [Verrucomicrobium sp. GAS474]|uniref:preprotein translocase subunit SecA n=1 Tax=Verrucomicrobium sp. GAS474 TaxID=1882831 RepID=UPI00087D27B9|nr:preprotein translocase subunit SecA [Verrucomicrobium sp. GAS474]SDU30697.1 preprotein translocase subunit SecA [Verrucomicrobium sp. GAS474]
MFQWLIKKVLGSKNQREVRRLLPIVEQINRIEEGYRSLSDDALRAKTVEFRERLAKGETLDAILPEAFAVVKNACRRFTEGKRMISVRGHQLAWEMIPFDVQLIGGMVLHSGRIAEMGTGEGKTLVATLPSYLNALSGRGVHIVTVNDYLASRDCEWVGEIHRFLGITVGCIQHGQSPTERRAQYAADITYGTNAEFGFDYLRDNGMATRSEDQVQRGHAYAIVDEVDSILIDEARVPLIISGPATVSNTQAYEKYKGPVARIVQEQQRELARLAEQVQKLIAANGPKDQIGRLLYKIKLGMPRNKPLLKLIEEPEVRRMMDTAELSFYQDTRRTELYAIKEELLFSIDEKNHEADLSERGRAYLSPADPNYFSPSDLPTRFHEIDSDPALADNAEEKLRQRAVAQALYEETSERIHNIAQLLRAYCLYEKDVQYVVQENKVVIVDEHTGRLMAGRRWSDGLHQAVEAKEGVQLERETQTLATITIQNYFRLYEKLSGMTGTAETEVNEFHDIYKLDVIVVPPNRKNIRKDLDDTIYKTRRAKYGALIQEIKRLNETGQPVLVGTISVESSELVSRMLAREKVPHHVLNAKFHQQEAEIVAGAGQKGAVTISTNMAGRGTDIKLGPGVAELGGLCVIGTERNESRRIDRQLRGRCSRQGDPGASRFFISFEDDLMRNFGDSRRISDLMTRLGMKDDEELQHPWLNRAVETAQKRVEERNYLIRKHTLQYDDVMNLQRDVIYSYRSEILVTEDPRAEVFEVVSEIVRGEALARLEGQEEPDAAGLLAWVNSTFPLGLRAEEIDFAPKGGAAAVGEELLARVTEAYDLKVKFEEEDAVKGIERYIILSAIDRLWQEHLYAMDGLRTSVGLRAYGQKDPLIEYKQEAYAMFEELMGRIKHEVVHNLFRSASSLTAFERFLSALPQRLVKADLPSGMAAPADAPVAPLPPVEEPAAKSESKPEPKQEEMVLPLRRDIPKVGRNDPCPNHPDVKFKNCPCSKGINLPPSRG